MLKCDDDEAVSKFLPAEFSGQQKSVSGDVLSNAGVTETCSGTAACWVVVMGILILVEVFETNFGCDS